MEMMIGNSGPAAADVIKDSDTAGFPKDVMEASMAVPVLVDFWAPWCGPCKTLGPLLEKLVAAQKGKIKLVKINVDENQELAGQMRVQSIPSVFAFAQGRPVDGFAGALPESQLKQFIDKLLSQFGGGGGEDPIAGALEQAAQLLEAGDFQQAGGLYQQILQADPTQAGRLCRPRPGADRPRPGR
jgi:putative thioredoxin